MASIVAAADRETLASMRRGWYSYSSVAGRQLEAVGNRRDGWLESASLASSGDP